MELSDLTAYAEEKYNIKEQHKWAGFPGFSVLADPDTDKWAALLMSQWDQDTGELIQRCDIKCGQQVLTDIDASYISKPYRMKGYKWVGVSFDNNTDPQIVCKLFDLAVNNETRSLFSSPDIFTGREFFTVREFSANDAPSEILQMMDLYEFGDGSFEQKCRNFYVQGKFMEDYEDHQPWTGDFIKYFPTYHDLNIRQLRGYFTWRSDIRKGIFRPIPTSMAYIYVYELLCGIGTRSPIDALNKMQQFCNGFSETGTADAGMRNNLNNWMLEYSVIKNVPAETARQYMDPVILKNDLLLTALRYPENHTDEEIYSALCYFGNKKLSESPVVMNDEAYGKHLFAQVWKIANRQLPDQEPVFDMCFGSMQFFKWYPLSNAVYWSEDDHQDTDYYLDECRSFHCAGGKWQVRRFEKMYYHLDKLNVLLHESDRILRRYLKTGRYLKEKPGEEWAGRYALAVIEDDKKQKLEASRPHININFSGLDKIRQDAQVTMESLLVESNGGPDDPVQISDDEKNIPETAETETTETEYADSLSLMGLSAIHIQVLKELIQGRSAAHIMKEARLMPSVVTDTINEAFYDEIGDSILECDGNHISVTDDYRDEVMRLLGGVNE